MMLAKMRTTQIRWRRAVALAGALALLASAGGCANATGDAVYGVAGGDKSGVYYSYGEGLARVATRELKAEFQVRETHGSVENLLLVGAGEALLGFAQGDTAVDAVRGEGSFADPLPIRAAANVYDEYVHVVVPADSSVTDLEQLAGRRVSLGAPNSGVQVIALRMLEAAGILHTDVDDLELGLEESIRAMQDREIEAFFWAGGLPTPGIEQLEKSMPIRILSLEADLVEKVNEGHAGVYRLAELPASFYNMEEPVTTMTVPNYLIVAEDAPADLVHDVLRVLFNARSELAIRVPSAGYLDRRQAIFTGPLKLHEGAERYYVETRH